MSDNPKRGHSVISTVGAVFLLVALFVLSLGPVAKLYSKKLIPPSAEAAIESVYAPLIYLVSHSPSAGRLYLWYLCTVWRIPKPT
jgi:hypothetical protein